MKSSSTIVLCRTLKSRSFTRIRRRDRIFDFGFLIFDRICDWSGGWPRGTSALVDRHDPHATSVSVPAPFNPPPGSIKVRATHEVMAARTTKFALLVVEFVATTGTPTPMLAQITTCSRRRRVRRRSDFSSLGPGLLLRRSTHSPHPMPPGSSPLIPIRSSIAPGPPANAPAPD